MKKRGLIAGMLICGMLATASPAMAKDNALNYEMMPMPITVHVDGKYVPMDVEPTITDGRTMLPLRAAGEAMGCTVEWDNDTRTASAYDPNSNKVISMQVGSNTIFAADADEFDQFADDPTSLEAIKFVVAHSTELDVPPTLINGRTLLPMRAFAEALDADVVWDNDLRDVIIDTSMPNAPEPVILTGMSPDAARFIKKYYVHSDSSDPIVGSWISTPQAAVGYPTYPGDPNIHATDLHFTFFSKYNGEYQTIHLATQSAQWYDNLSIVVERWVGHRVTPTSYYTTSPYFNGVIYHRAPGNGYSSLCMFAFTQYQLNGDNLLQTGKHGSTGGSVAAVNIPYIRF